MANLYEISKKAASMGTPNGYKMEMEGYVYIAYVAEDSLREDTRRSLLDNEDDLFIGVYKDPKQQGYVVPLNSEQPPRLFSNVNLAYRFFYSCLAELDDLKLYSYNPDDDIVSGFHDNEDVYNHVIEIVTMY